VVFRDLVQRRTVYERTFSNYGDYPSAGASLDQRREAIETLQLTELQMIFCLIQFPDGK
jgi:hypothetical protein